MNPLSRRESWLLGVALALALLAALVPAVAQPSEYHHFADQRNWLGIAHAADVLSNLPFAIAGLWGLLVLGRVPAVNVRVPRRLAALFFAGLVLTALCSAWYHLQPDDAGLAVDRLGMTAAFAGLLGLGAATHVSQRAGLALAVAVLLLGPLTIALALYGGNVIPWAALQGGGMALLLALVLTTAQTNAPFVRWGGVIACYILAKLAEWADPNIFALTGGVLSGHSIKHIVAAGAAWPVIAAFIELSRRTD